MRRFPFWPLLTLFIVTNCIALPNDPAEYAVWEQEMMQAIHDQATEPPEEAIPKLGLWVVQLSRPHNIERSDDRPVFTAARDALISIPGHAEYFAKRIKDAQREVENQRGGDYEGTAKSKLLDEQMYAFQRLEQLPSPETVRILGEFLFDPWGLNKDAKPGEKPNNDRLGEASNAKYALHALSRLPLETRANAVPAEKTNYWADIETWKLWYSQIKAGTRSFRFKGDPHDYNLSGPLVAAIDPTAKRASRGLTGDADASEAVTKQEKLRGESKRPGILLLGACLLLGLAGWLAMASRKKA